MTEATAGDPPAGGLRTALLIAGLVPFVLLCTANAATYRYAASDQAFYIPAVLLAMHPQFYPRDAPLVLAQARLTLVDESIGGLSSFTGLSLPVLFGLLYVISLIVLAVAAWLIASRWYRRSWTALALLAALTLRHSISRTGTNTLEGYFHPRQLAFALGALALAMCLTRRWTLAAMFVAAAAAIHPTTAMWFAVWLATAAAIAEPRWRRWMAMGAGIACLAAGWALAAGPLAGRLARMDAAWIATLAEKTYLFPLEWPLGTWMINLAYIPVIVLVHRWRRAAGLADRLESAIVGGAVALVALFAAILPLNAAHVALAVQLQPARLFWMLDLLAIVYAVWALAEGTFVNATRVRVVAAVIILVSVVRGSYVVLVEFPDRPLARVDIRNDDWGRVMAWARTTDPGSGWLADPMHAVRYGTSVRAAAGRDVLVEAVKDAAVGMYDRDVAMRTRDRLAAVGDFNALTTGRAQALAATYGLDYLVSEGAFPLPLAFESGNLHVYRLPRSPGR